MENNIQGFFSRRDLGGINEDEFLQSLKIANKKQEIYTDLKISPLQEIKELVNTIPNDQELGETIRNYINRYYE